MEPQPLTPAFVRQALATLADIHITEAEAAALLPLIAANQESLARLERFDLREVRSAVLFDPTWSPTAGGPA